MNHPSLLSGLTSLPAFLENMFTEALGGPPGPGSSACGALGSDGGGGGGAFFCREKTGIRTPPLGGPQAGASTGAGFPPGVLVYLLLWLTDVHPSVLLFIPDDLP